jgi:hypothetical protein
MSRLDLFVDQLRSARAYTTGLLETIKPDDWFRQPAGGVSHVAWQVGHLAFAEYKLLLERFRGARPSDIQLISEEFMNRFGRGSMPEPDPSRYPAPSEIRKVFDRVHFQALEELKGVADEELDQPPLIPHPLCPTKLGALIWCNQHEMLHTGQIGLVRRLLGYAPYR